MSPFDPLAVLPPIRYAREIGSNLREVEEESIQDYVENRQTLLDLHAEIEACDDILAKMEGLLFHFQVWTGWSCCLAPKKEWGGSRDRGDCN